jgi:uncharacterized protein YfdQ (DUF2303 family)
MPTETEAVTELAKKSFGTVPAQVIDLPDGRTFIVHRDDFNLNQVTMENKVDVLMPKVTRQGVSVGDRLSLIDYANRFKNENSVMFADVNNNSIMCVIDYHAPDGARLVKHHARLTLPFSEQWLVWIKSNDKLMAHVDFANFLEENALDVTRPAGAELYEMIKDISVKQDSYFTTSIRMGDHVAVTYQKDEDATTTKAQMELPTEFEIRLPIYFLEREVAVRCFMRRKISDGHLSLGYKMNRIETTRQAEFGRIVYEIAGATGLPVYYGTIG